MRTPAFVFFGLLALALQAGAEEMTRTFPVRPGSTLLVDSHRGRVSVEETDREEIAVTLEIDLAGMSEKRAKVLRDALELKFEPLENGVRVVARDRRSLRWDIGGDGDLGLLFHIEVPRRCDVTAKVRDGSVTIGNVQGRVEAEVETGTIFLRRIEGNVKAAMQFGQVVISRCSGDANVKVMRGLIRLGTIGGQVVAKNTGGDIEVMTAKGTVTAHADVGSVTVGFAPPLKGDSRITTAGGAIVAQISPETGCRVAASAGWGRVNSLLNIEPTAGANGTRRLEGRLNGGGPLIALHADGGDVSITRELTMIDDSGMATDDGPAPLPTFSDETRDNSTRLQPTAVRAKSTRR